MPLTISQATDVNTLIDYLGHTPRPSGTIPTGVEARDALARLADHANKALMSGATGDDVRSLWALPEDPDEFRACIYRAPAYRKTPKAKPGVKTRAPRKGSKP